MDLSWPHSGTSVNDGISKEKYLEQNMWLQYPMVDYLCKTALTLMKDKVKVKGFKVDLDRAFKQVYMDLKDWPLLGITWMKVLYFDKTVVMGNRSAPYICQCITSFSRHVMENLGHFVANYVNDFMGLGLDSSIWRSYRTLNNLLHDCGTTEALQKAIPPTECLEFLGVWYDLNNMTIMVTGQRMQELVKELRKWQHKGKYKCKQLESLLGKLQFVSNCV